MRGWLINVSKYNDYKGRKPLPRQQDAAKVMIVINPARRQRDVISSVGCIRSSDEVSVIERERRDTVIQCQVFVNNH